MAPSRILSYARPVEATNSVIDIADNLVIGKYPQI